MQSEQEYYEGHNTNTDPREQQQQQVYREDNYNVEPGMAQSVDEKFRTRPPQRRRRAPWFLILLLIAILAAEGVINQGSFSSVRSTLPARTFPVAGLGRLVVNNSSGTVHIHTGNTNSIIVQGTKYIYGLGRTANDLQVQEGQDGNTITVSAQQEWNLFGARDAVDLDITVPSTAEVDIHNASGNINIDDVSGQVKADTGSGYIKVNNLNGQVTLSTVSGNVNVDGLNGQLWADTSSGTIKMNGVNGQVTLSTSSGDIEMDQAKISGQSVLKTSSGSIHLNGSLDPTGTYQMETGSGDVTINLPIDSSFQLRDSTDSGSVHNDFGGTQVGNSPQSSLSIKTGSGSINIHKQ